MTEEQLRRAEARGSGMLEARATAAHYDPTAGRVVIDLANGCAYAFPAQRVQDLQDASDEDLADVEVDGAGFNLHWPKLDVDLYVPALVAGVFGTRAWITSELARVAGRTRSPAKAAAARSKNGAKGGGRARGQGPDNHSLHKVALVDLAPEGDVFARRMGELPADFWGDVDQWRPG